MNDKPFKLLLVDDEPDIVDSLSRTFRRDYAIVTANSGAAAIELLGREQVDLIISDQRMPGVTGDAVLKFALQNQPEAIRILLTGYADLESLVRCVNEAGIYKYISKPWEPENLRLTVVRALESLDLSRQLSRANHHLRQAYLDAVSMLSVACEGKDQDTGYHVQRVQHFTTALARQLGIAVDQADHMGVMSILHDVGKLYIPDEILKKPAKLDADEWNTMRRHPEFGVRILGDNPFYAMARDIALCHHENIDGSGYPAGLKDAAIPLAARIVKVADVFDALTSRRPYKDPWDSAQALAWMQQRSGTEFDAAAIEALQQLAQQGELARIMQQYDPDADPAPAGVPS